MNINSLCFYLQRDKISFFANKDNLQVVLCVCFYFNEHQNGEWLDLFVCVTFSSYDPEKLDFFLLNNKFVLYDGKMVAVKNAYENEIMTKGR